MSKPAAAWERFVTRPLRRRLRNPFKDGHAVQLVHVADHRVGTVWFRRVLWSVAREHGLRTGRMGAKADDSWQRADVVLCPAIREFDRSRLGPFRGSHMVRDPRDVVVSGYHYHLWTDERWAHVPHERYRGLSYQDYLRSLDAEEGMAAEIRRCSERELPRMAAWDYHQPEFLELRYEDVIRDERTWFTRLFEHYGFTDDAVERSVALALERSFSKVSGRDVGATQEGSHLRSGQPGQWRDVFTEGHKALFRELNGDLLQTLGYETSDDW